MLPARMFEKQNSVILVSSERQVDDNIFYLLGKKPSNDTLLLLLKKGKKPLLFVSDLEIGNYKRKDVLVKRFAQEEIKKELKKLHGRAGINFESLSVSGENRLKKYTKAKFFDISGVFAEMRAVKSGKEVKKIKNACKTSLEIMEEVPELIERCRTEEELATKMEFLARENGADGLGFPTIIASGKNSAVPHHESGRNKISRGFLIVDFGCSYDGYCADLTRTFFVGNAGEGERNVFAAVYDAKKAATGLCFSGNEARNAYLAAEKIIEKKLGQKLLHSVGHGLGLRTHDFPPGIHAGSKFSLKEGMCITVEPGYYKKGFGGVRLEDVIVVKRKKCRELTKTKNELIEI